MSGVTRRSPDVRVELLVEAGAVMASSLDPTTTMNQVARLTVPRIADLCVIDLREGQDSIREVAVAASDSQIAVALEALRRRHPLDPDGEHPVARVIRSGEPVLLAEMNDMLMRSFAQGSEHARFMIDNRYHSAVVAPLLARGRTLGALSILRLGDSEPYDAHDLDLACELARRAALAIDNARLYSEVRAGRGAPGGDPREPRRGDHAGRRARPDGVRQPGRSGSARRELPGRADERPAGDDHVPLPGARRARSGARPGGDAGQASVRRRAPTAVAGAQHRPRERRGALADRARLADPRSRQRPRAVRGQRVREHHRRQAGTARRELHGRGQPRARLLDGLCRDAPASGAPGRPADRRLVRGRRAGRERRDRTRGRPPRRPRQARAGRTARQRLPPGAGRSAGGAGGDPYGPVAAVHRHRPGGARRLRARRRPSASCCVRSGRVP